MGRSTADDATFDDGEMPRLLLENLIGYDKLAKLLQYPEQLRLHPAGEESGRLLQIICKTAGAGHILELGSGCGYSTVWLAAAARETGGSVTATEKDAAKRSIAQELLRIYGLDGLVTWKFDALTAAAETAGEPADVVFLDLPKGRYRKALRIVAANNRRPFTLLADNMMSHRLQTADFIRELDDMGCEHVCVPIGKGIEICRVYEAVS
ncbi:class I SAM-dependent methyltransferase [Actinoplanes sp. NPDC051851]|uniref:O-methyltransferase n=1 Tax=Actinoplanes sp. NPDC051851 TaxID=3154753 RepID=UPI003449D32B